LPLAVSIECIHTYSLIHDDLPAMDDDDLRRGKPSLHKAFGEAMAILAGDALLAFAFQVLTSPRAERICPPVRLLSVVNELAAAAGSEKLVAGQVMDMISEGAPAAAETVDYIVRSKTGALIRASLTCGATMAGATPEQVDILGRFGDDLGVVFQTRDDLLDIEGDPLELGKAVKKDQQRGKLTYPRVLGREKTKSMVRELVGSAVATITPLGPEAEPLALIAGYLGERIN
jgi:geranylgeranyl diphosphate synthase, type II